MRQSGKTFRGPSYHITKQNTHLTTDVTGKHLINASTTISIIKLIRMEKSQNKPKISDRKTAFLNSNVTIRSNLYPFPDVSLSTAHIVQETKGNRVQERALLALVEACETSPAFYTNCKYNSINNNLKVFCPIAWLCSLL